MSYRQIKKGLKTFFIVSILLLSILLPATINSALDPPLQLHLKIYNGAEEDIAYDVSTDSNDNIIVTGVTRLSADYAILTIKYDPELTTEIWSELYNTPHHDEAHAIAIDSEDNIIVTGKIYNATAFNDDFLTLKYSSTGTLLWNQTYNSNGIDIAWDVAIDSNDNILVTGQSSNNYLTIKYDGDGNRLWTQDYDSGDTDYAKGIIADSSDNIIVTGYQFQGYNSCCYTIKYNSNGEELWNQTYQNGINAFSNAIAVDSFDNIIITGSLWNDPTGSDYCTVKYSSIGTELWVKQYTGTYEDYSYAIAVDSYNNIFVAGSSYHYSTRENYHTMKYDENGNLLWETFYDHGLYEDDRAYGVTVDSQNKLIVTGASTGEDDFDYLTIKYGEHPCANFIYEPTLPTDLDLIQFTDLSTDTDGTIQEWFWDFGDGNTSTLQHPMHQYLDNGTYLVTLTVTDDDQINNMTSQYLCVSNVAPYANFSWEQIGEPTENKILFVSESVDFDGYLVDWLWDFGDDALGDGDIEIHSYEEQGPYDVTLTVIDNDGGFGNITKTIVINDTKPPEILDNTSSEATTGDPFTVNATVTDNVAVDTVNILYWYGDDTPSSKNLSSLGNDYWETKILVNDTLDILHYLLTAYDTTLNSNTTALRNITISDNDGPEIDDSTPSQAFAGDPFTFNATITDNIHLSEVWVQYWIDSGDPVNVCMYNSSEHQWKTTIFINLTSQEIFYSIVAQDSSNNSKNTSIHNITITPNSQPFIPQDPSPPHNQTEVSIHTLLQWTGGDPDPGDTITYDIYLGQNNPPPQVCANHTESMYTPTLLQYNMTYFWRIISWDNHNVSAEGPLWKFTTEDNTAPIVSDIPDQTIEEGGIFSLINLSVYVEDEEDPDEDILWSYTGNTELLITILDQRANITIPYPDWYGQEVITFTATDTGGLTDNDSVLFTVTAINDAPVVDDIPNQTISEGELFTVIYLNDYVEDIEDPDEDIDWTYQGNAELLISILNQIATISLPYGEWVGEEAITFIATDTGGLDASDIAVFTVTAVNDPPLVSDIPDQTIEQGDIFSLINLSVYVEDEEDPDEDILWSFSGNTELLITILDQKANITLPHPDWYGQEVITFTATDTGGLNDSDDVFFTVTLSNDPPVAVEDYFIVLENAENTILDVLGNDFDINGDDLVITEVTTPQHGSVVNHEEYLSYTPVSSYSGTDTFQYNISDGKGGWSLATVHISIEPEAPLENNPPFTPHTPFPSDSATGVSTNADMTWAGGDPDPGDTVTYDVYFGTSASPPKIVSNTSLLTFNPLLNYDTYYFWRVVAWDTHDVSSHGPVWNFRTEEFIPSSGGGSGDEVEEIIIPPAFNQQPIANVSAGEPYLGYVNEFIPFDGTSSYDPDGTIIKWFWDFGDGTNGTGKIIYHFYLQPGTYNITLTVTDSKYATDTDTTIAVISVPNNLPSNPVINGTFIGKRNVTYTYSFLSTDADGDRLRYLVNWDDGTESISDVVEENTSSSLDHQWSQAGLFYLLAYAQDENNGSSGLSVKEVLIDAEWVGTFGYLVDTDGDGIYDVYHSNITDRDNEMLYDKGVYFLDIDFDGIWDYVYDKKTKMLTPFEFFKPESSEANYSMILGIPLLVCLIVCVVFTQGKLRDRREQRHYKKNKIRRPKKQYKPLNIRKIEKDVDRILKYDL